MGKEVMNSIKGYIPLLVHKPSVIWYIQWR
jgi:hypothetical protein